MQSLSICVWKQFEQLFTSVKYGDLLCLECDLALEATWAKYLSHSDKIQSLCLLFENHSKIMWGWERGARLVCRHHQVQRHCRNVQLQDTPTSGAKSLPHTLTATIDDWSGIRRVVEGFRWMADAGKSHELCLEDVTRPITHRQKN